MGKIRRLGKQIVGEASILDFRIFEQIGIDRCVQKLKEYQRKKIVYVVNWKWIGYNRDWLEQPLCKWFKKHFKELGFDKILGERTKKYTKLKKKMGFWGYPDFLVSKGKNWYRLEVECFSSIFHSHHKTDYADIILCYDKDKEVEGIEIISLRKIKQCQEIINVLEIPSFLYIYDKEIAQEYRRRVIHSVAELIKEEYLTEIEEG